ncbi:MAG TPA: acyl-CoA dehydrogenase family protein [Polyangia bacterium]|nr:acyl-CoA dehydrogenase family protein [Polyangia bacterium]
MHLLLEWLLSSPALEPKDTPQEDGPQEDWWTAYLAAAHPWATPLERAAVGGFIADRLAYAFAAGYHNALRALLPGLPGLPDDHPAALCITEDGGAHPRAIATRLEPTAEGHGRLIGTKRWATLADRARVLFVAASLGQTPDGRNQLRLVRVPADAPGVTLTLMPETPFIPEIRHATVRFDGAPVSAADIYPGDGYQRYIKPFRTVEDLHVHAALVGHLLGVARRHRWPRESCEQLATFLAALRTLADAPPASAAIHVTLAGLLELFNRFLSETQAHWQLVDADTRTRWQRDQGLLAVAARARGQRREVAWQALTAQAHPA